jgi:hypothetical protein
MGLPNRWFDRRTRETIRGVHRVRLNPLSVAADHTVQMLAPLAGRRRRRNSRPDGERARDGDDRGAPERGVGDHGRSRPDRRLGAAIANSAADGDGRSCTLVDGAEMVEPILERSDAQRYYDYEIVDAPMPVRFYRSRLTVTERGGIAHVDWTGEFEPQRPADEDRLVEAFSATYRGGLDALRDQVEARGPRDRARRAPPAGPRPAGNMRGGCRQSGTAWSWPRARARTRSCWRATTTSLRRALIGGTSAPDVVTVRGGATTDRQAPGPANSRSFSSVR